MIGLIIIAVVVITLILLLLDNRRRLHKYLLPSGTRVLLIANVPFFNALNDSEKDQFEVRVKDFLTDVNIRGIDVEVEDIDRVLIASAAIMLIFSFPDWKYNNISEVLLYQNAFSEDFRTSGQERNVLGMVGDGAMHREMVLSRPSLRASFSNATDGHNTAIHEFAHLIDKADGATDGIPEYLLTRPHLLPWANLVKETISEMKKSRHPDIDIYGATNDAEFFAVVSEYFFERPEKLKEHHPELFQMMDEMFHPKKA